MAVNLSPVGGVAGQFFDNNGDPLVGGKLFTYAAGTTTPQVTYTSSSGVTPNSNPIILNGGGRVPSEIWLTDGLSYKFVLYSSTDQLIGSWDNISGINSNFVNYTASQEIQTATAGQTVFTLTTMEYQPGTNSLTVYVDGVNQYGPGAQYAYVETNSTTVTFNSGLHVGAEVKFTTVQQATSSATDAAQVAYQPAGSGAVATNVQAKLRETVSVKDFGAVGDGVTDDTAAIQAALTYAETTNKALYIPRGLYLFTQLIFPSTGEVYGESVTDYGFPGGTEYGTTLMQTQGVNDDAIIFSTYGATLQRTGPFYFHDFAVTKQSGWTDTIGNGISFRRTGDRADLANHATVAGIAVMTRVLVRGFPESGIYQRRGGRPAMFQDVYTLFNGKYGYETDGVDSNFGLWINGFTADGNIDAAIKIAGAASNNVVSITNVYAEPRTDNPYGNASGFSYAQPRVIEVNDCNPNSVINIENIQGNAVGISGVSTVVDAAIYVDCSSDSVTPKILFNGVATRKIGTTAGNGYVLSDALNSTNVPYTINSGVFVPSGVAYSFSGVGANLYGVLGGDGTVVPYTSVQNGYQVKGNLPGYALKAVNAAANEGNWFIRCSAGGQLLVNSVDDAGTSAGVGFSISRSGAVPAIFDIPTANVQFGGAAFSMTSVPTYADNASAVAGGLAVGRVYKTATGELRIVV